MDNEYFNRPVLLSYLISLGYNNIPEFLNKYLSVPSLLRLKKVGYFCGMDYASKNIYNFKEYVSRYDHSLAVALITWKYSKDIKATIAGLFHDVGAPVFSHVIDYMNKDYELQESTEEFTKNIIYNDTQLLANLSKDNINPEEIINFKNYSLVDNDRPKMCADRLDGIILTSLFWTKTFQIKDIKGVIDDIIVFINNHEKEIGFNSLSICKKIVEANSIIDEYCHSDADIYMMNLLANIVKIGLDNDYYSYEELYESDEVTLLRTLKMKSQTNEELNTLLHEFENITKELIPKSSINNIKKRIINPIVNGNRYL